MSSEVVTGSDTTTEPSVVANLMVGIEPLGSFTASANLSAQHPAILTQLAGTLVLIAGPASIVWIGSHLLAPWWATALVAISEVLGGVMISRRL
jgi:hypothetical protein